MIGMWCMKINHEKRKKTMEKSDTMTGRNVYCVDWVTKHSHHTLPLMNFCLVPVYYDDVVEGCWTLWNYSELSCCSFCLSLFSLLSFCHFIFSESKLSVRGCTGGWMDGWMREFTITSAKLRPNRQPGTTVMMWMALVARMKLPSNMAALGIEPGSRG